MGTIHRTLHQGYQIQIHEATPLGGARGKVLERDDRWVLLVDGRIQRRPSGHNGPVGGESYRHIGLGEIHRELGLRRHRDVTVGVSRKDPGIILTLLEVGNG